MSRLSIGKAWEETSAFLAREARLVTPVALALFAVPATLMGWANPSGQPGAGPAGMGWPLTLVALLVTMIGQMTVAALAIGWTGSLGSAISLAARRVWGLLASVLLIFLPVTILAILVLAMLVGASGLTDASQLTPETLAATPGVALFMMLLLVTFLVIGVRLFPISAVAISEMSSPFPLLRRAWRLTKGSFWRLLAVLLLVLIAAMVASAAVTTVVGSLMTLAAGEMKPFSLSALITALADGIIASAITAVSASLVGRIYVQLSAGQPTVPDVARDG
jgi:hypothetical protein